MGTKVLSRAGRGTEGSGRGNEWGLRVLGLSGFASLGSGSEPGAPEANPYLFFMTQLNGTTAYEDFPDPLGAFSPEPSTEP